MAAGPTCSDLPSCRASSCKGAGFASREAVQQDPHLRTSALATRACSPSAPSRQPPPLSRKKERKIYARLQACVKGALSQRGPPSRSPALASVQSVRGRPATLPWPLRMRGRETGTPSATTPTYLGAWTHVDPRGPTWTHVDPRSRHQTASKSFGFWAWGALQPAAAATISPQRLCLRERSAALGRGLDHASARSRPQPLAPSRARPLRRPPPHASARLKR